jgi:hypothetical protein
MGKIQSWSLVPDPIGLKRTRHFGSSLRILSRKTAKREPISRRIVSMLAWRRCEAAP